MLNLDRGLWRLWIVVTIAWAAWMVWIFSDCYQDLLETNYHLMCDPILKRPLVFFAGVLLKILAPSVMLAIVLLGIRWVLRGFLTKS